MCPYRAPIRSITFTVPKEVCLFALRHLKLACCFSKLKQARKIQLESTSGQTKGPSGDIGLYFYLLISKKALVINCCNNYRPAFSTKKKNYNAYARNCM